MARCKIAMTRHPEFECRAPVTWIAFVGGGSGVDAVMSCSAHLSKAIRRGDPQGAHVWHVVALVDDDGSTADLIDVHTRLHGGHL